MGLTSSDVVDTALSVLMVDAVNILLEDVKKLNEVIAEKAKQYKYTPMMGRTHGVHAEPITLGWKFALMLEEFRRAEERLQRAKEIASYGKLSGAVGTYAHLEPSVEEYVCEKLGLRPAAVATQIIQRDHHAEYMSMLALVSDSMERWATEFRALQKTEVRELEEPFREGQKGSSAMPHKRNPVICERICGLARLIRGYSVTAHENVTLWHERDISHSSSERVIMPDATIALNYMFHKMIEVVKDINVYPENMQKNIDFMGGLIFSQRVLLALIDKSISRDEAYKIVQDNAMRVWKNEGKFLDLLLKDDRVKKYLKDEELKECFDLKYYLKNVDVVFERIGI
jgi:adenylosuccinate lyase